jgi:HSP20 family protein
MKRNRRRNDDWRWDPFRELTALQERVDRLFHDAFGAFGFGGDSGQISTGYTFAPPVDIYEDDNSLKFRLEIPGVQEKEVEITLDGDVLTVRGERKPAGKQENYLRVERPYGRFHRSFTLPSSVDPNSLTANYVNGVLEIEMAKRAEAKPKQITVNVGQKALPAGAEKAA